MQVMVVSADGKPVADTVVMVQPVVAGSATAAPAPVVIAQKNIRFQPTVSVVPVGGTLRFVNQDSYDHHVRSLPGGPLGTVAPAKQFDLRIPPASGGRQPSQDVKVDTAGVIALGCHLHGSMRGHVYVSPTPWAAVTDAQGRVTIEGVPEGAAELRLWHPEQLVDQPVQRVQVAAGSSPALNGQLNFAPKPPRRSAPAARDSGSGYSY